jgi:hypothetical protein
MRADFERHRCQCEVTRSVAGKTARKIGIGTIYPATIGVLPAFLSRIASGSTGDIIRNLETGQINLGFIRPVENIGSLRFFSMANDEYLLAIGKDSRLAGLDEIGIEDLRDQKIISLSMIWRATLLMPAMTRLR